MERNGQGTDAIDERIKSSEELQFFAELFHLGRDYDGGSFREDPDGVNPWTDFIAHWDDFVKRFREMLIEHYTNVNMASGMFRGRAEQAAERDVDFRMRNHERRQLERRRQNYLEAAGRYRDEHQRLERRLGNRRFLPDERLTDEELQERRRMQEARRLEREAQRRADALGREINQFNRSDPMVQRQTRGFDATFMERVFRSTFGGGSFSAYDIMRGGIDRNDPVVNELREANSTLRSMDGKMDDMNRMD